MDLNFTFVPKEKEKKEPFFVTAYSSDLHDLSKKTVYNTTEAWDLVFKWGAAANTVVVRDALDGVIAMMKERKVLHPEIDEELRKALEEKYF